MANRLERHWATCPECSANMVLDIPPARNSPYTTCPFCHTELVPIWWQRALVAGFGLAMAIVIPATMGLVGVTLFFASVLFTLPGLIAAYVFVFAAIPPKYVKKRGATLTLFRL